MTFETLPPEPSKPVVENPAEAEFVPNTGDPEIDELGIRPIHFTGYHGFDPRSARSYPDTTEGRMNLLIRMNEGELDEADEARAEELMSQMQILDGEFTHVPELPPKPLTAEALDELLRSGRFDYDADEVACWVDCEREYIDDIAVGEYREYVAGYILAFWIDAADNHLIRYMLIPDYSPTGFSWYRQLPTNRMVESEAILDTSQARRLVSLLESDDPIEILNPPDRVLNTAALFETSMMRGEQSATPMDWVETSCELNDEVSESFLPRYDATFVYEPSGIVVEVTPLPISDAEKNRVDDTMDQMAQAMGIDSDSSPQQHDDIDLADVTTPTHRITVHFAPEEIEQTIREQYGDEMTGPVVHQVLRRISELA